jgi:hypothetical protein
MPSEDWSTWTDEQLEGTLFRAQPGSVHYEKAKYLLEKRRHEQEMEKSRVHTYRTILNRATGDYCFDRPSQGGFSNSL